MNKPRRERLRAVLKNVMKMARPDSAEETGEISDLMGELMSIIHEEQTARDSLPDTFSSSIRRDVLDDNFNEMLMAYNTLSSIKSKTSSGLCVKSDYALIINNLTSVIER